MQNAAHPRSPNQREITSLTTGPIVAMVIRMTALVEGLLVGLVVNAVVFAASWMLVGKRRHGL